MHNRAFGEGVQDGVNRENSLGKYKSRWLVVPRSTPLGQHRHIHPYALDHFGGGEVVNGM